MTTDLIETDNYTLTRFWGGKKRGVMYQITQDKPDNSPYDRYVSLNPRDILKIAKIIKKDLDELA